MNFQDFNLNPLIIKAALKRNYDIPTMIQEKAIPAILSGVDVLGIADTGTGKTAAYAMPMLHMLVGAIQLDSQNKNSLKPIRGLVLVPTRELAIQIGESFDAYGELLDNHVGVLYGGITPKRHIKVLKREPDIIVATPGRLLDMVKQGYADLSKVEILVLDEADRMLDLGMIEDVKSILSKLPKKRQNLLFSATMPKEILSLVNSILKHPIKIKIESQSNIKSEIHQMVYFVEEPLKTSLLLTLIKDRSFESVLVFTRTKKKADIVSKAINLINIRAKAIHGDKNQSERLKVLQLFKNKEVKVLVATDIAARGIDIDKLTHVINMDVPSVPETYIHRIGRTGRAGFEGVAISLCSKEELEYLQAIEKFQGKTIEVMIHTGENNNRKIK